MKEIETVKQGIEVEGFIRTKDYIDNYFAEYSYPHGGKDYPKYIGKLLEEKNIKIWKKPHYDTDSCTEISLNPFSNLEELSLDLRNTISTVYDYCNSVDWLYMLLGTTPVAEIAGGHIHNSIPKWRDTTITNFRFIRKKMYPYQFLIALLSQNSNIERSRVLNRKDARIRSPSSHSSFSTAGGMLAILRKNKRTLECRYPSSCGYHQFIILATFLKALIFLENNEDLYYENDNNLEECLDEVLINGSKGIIYVELSKSKKFNDLSRKYIPLPMSVLFAMIINSYNFREALERSKRELSSKDRHMVEEFFRILSYGYTFTDLYNKMFADLIEVYDLSKFPKFKDKGKEACYRIHKIGELSFLKDIPIWKLIKPNELKNQITLEYLNSLIKDRVIRKDYPSFSSKNKCNGFPLIKANDYQIEDRVIELLNILESEK